MEGHKPLALRPPCPTVYMRLPTLASTAQGEDMYKWAAPRRQSRLVAMCWDQ